MEVRGNMCAVAGHPLRSILVVEDEARTAVTCCAVALEADGYEVAVVSNGREAMKHLRATADTCLIVLDLYASDHGRPALPVVAAARPIAGVDSGDRRVGWGGGGT